MRKSHSISLFKGQLPYFTAVVLKGLAAICTLLFTLAISRQFDVEVAGTIFLFFNIVMAASVIGRFGFDMPLIKYISILNDRNDNVAIRGLLNFSLCITAISCTLISAVILMALALYTNTYQIDIKTSVLVVFLTLGVSSNVLFSHAFQGLGFFREATFTLQSGAMIVFCALVYGLCVTTVFGGLSLLLLSVLSIVFFSVFRMLRYLNDVSDEFSTVASIPREYTDKLKRASKPLWIVSVVNAGLPFLYGTIVGFVATPLDVASFFTNHRISLLCTLPLMGVNLVFSRVIAMQHASGPLKVATSKLEKTMRFSFLLSLMIAFTLMLSYEYIYEIFGQDGISEVTILWLFVFAALFNSLTGPVTMMLAMTGHEGDLCKISLFTAVVSIISMAALGVVYDLVGIVASYALTSVLNNVYASYVVSKKLNFNTFRYLSLSTH